MVSCKTPILFVLFRANSHRRLAGKVTRDSRDLEISANHVPGSLERFNLLFFLNFSSMTDQRWAIGEKRTRQKLSRFVSSCLIYVSCETRERNLSIAQIREVLVSLTATIYRGKFSQGTHLEGS